ncbi:MAG: V-type ATP synthase subunit E [Eubacteriales bacterium]|jgi:V/A-type H+-transporting ATPase subunit E|nr:V-type ATP synthase subunit E [Eubacteriales bacterium]MDD3289340.1 V-type ATP synthase subunit E [Eubacteriales bacterium]MDD3863502.1 V-type ATP synthase subunit E [Eubacteriales bacterium]MDD4445407.1 V-type ATP synthase subunit E [Eubacteriales bacterium]
MSIEQIKDKILESAQQDARRIFDKAKMESRAKVYEAQRIADIKIREAKEKAIGDATRLKSRKESMANLEARKMHLATKQEVISACFEEALAELRKLPEDRYLQLLAHKLEEMDYREGEIVLNKSDRDAIGEKLLEQVNRDGRHFVLSSDTLDALGGFVLRIGRIELDSTLEMMVSSVREAVMPEVVSALFD